MAYKCIAHRIIKYAVCVIMFDATYYENHLIYWKSAAE